MGLLEVFIFVIIVLVCSAVLFFCWELYVLAIGCGIVAVATSLFIMKFFMNEAGS